MAFILIGLVALLWIAAGALWLADASTSREAVVRALTDQNQVRSTTPLSLVDADRAVA